MNELAAATRVAHRAPPDSWVKRALERFLSGYPHIPGVGADPVPGERGASEWLSALLRKDVFARYATPRSRGELALVVRK